MIALQVILSMSSMVLHNCILNKICKKDLKTNSHIHTFNMFAYLICMVFLAISLINNKVSLFTVLLALLFGVVTVLAAFYKMLSLSNGPMHITLLITTSSMIIPTMSGIFFGETFSLNKLLVVIALIAFIYISLGKTSDIKANKKWLLFCFLSFVFQGSIGVLQKIHQSSVYKTETSGFLFVTFLCSVIYSKIMAKKSVKELGFNKKHILFALVSGICIYGMNILNLKLSGILPSQLFFPLVNGSAIVLSSLISVVFFKEKLSRKQYIGLFGGILSLVLICIVK